MLYKPRSKSVELIILEILNKRTDLSSKDHQHYTNLKKGYEGELLFDSLIESLECECYILNDLLLEVNHTIFQIDNLIILDGKISVNEVKNFDGDYYYESHKLYKKPKLEVINPLHQLSRSESLLNQLLRNHGYQLPIDASVIFINPNFTLYQAPLNLQAILPTQVHNYIKTLQATPSKRNHKHKRIADLLLSLHINNSPYNKIPSYNYEQLRKGITCAKCDSFSIFLKGRKCKCKKCGYEELGVDAVLRSVKEYQILFPEQKITTNLIHDWCQVVPSKARIRNILAKKFTLVGEHQWAYFE